MHYEFWAGESWGLKTVSNYFYIIFVFLNKCCRWFYMLFVFEHLKRCQISYLFVDVICLGVLKNGAKYHFCMRKSTGDMSKVISSLASRFLNFRTACISTPLPLPCADIDHFCMRKSTGDKYVQGDFLMGLTFSQFSHSMNFNPTPTSLCRHISFLYEKKYRRYVRGTLY